MGVSEMHRVDAAGALHDGDYRRTSCPRGYAMHGREEQAVRESSGELEFLAVERLAGWELKPG